MFKKWMRAFKYLFFLFFLAFLYSILPWRYYHQGFDEVSLPIAGGELKFELVDQVNAKQNNKYCLFARFNINDHQGEVITIQIDQIGTKSNPIMRSNITKTGKTAEIYGSDNTKFYFTAEGVSRLVLTNNEQLKVIGSLLYKGRKHAFESTLKLKFWGKRKDYITFCV